MPVNTFIIIKYVIRTYILKFTTSSKLKMIYTVNVRRKKIYNVKKSILKEYFEH